MSFTQFSLNSGGGESLDLHISKHQPKPKKPFQMTQKGWILTTAVLLVTCLGLSIYVTYEAVHKGDRIDQILDQISHRFPSLRERLIDFAAMKNQPKWVETLLRSNSKKHLEQKGHTFYSTEITKLLIDFGYDIDSQNNTDNKTPLFYAAGQPNAKEVIELLLQNGANVNAQDNMHFTPLHIAVLKKLPENVKVLLEHGAEVDSTTLRPQFHTPLTFAVWVRNFEIAKILMEYGADPALEGRDHISPHFHAYEFAKNREYPESNDIYEMLDNYFRRNH